MGCREEGGKKAEWGRKETEQERPVNIEDNNERKVTGKGLQDRKGELGRGNGRGE